MEVLQSNRSQELDEQIKKLAGREVQLWTVAVVVLLLFAAGFLVVALPRLMWPEEGSPWQPRHMLQMLTGLFVVIMIFAAYVLEQKRVHHSTRQELVREIVFAERLQSYSLVDPLTQIFNRRYLDQVLPKEIGRAQRNGTALTFLMLEVKGWGVVNKRLGELTGDQMLIEAAQLLKGTFRGSDTVLRYDETRFLVIFPETSEHQASCALRRMLTRVDNWNLESRAPYELVFNGGLATYKPGADAVLLLDRLARQVAEQSREWRVA